MVDGRDLKSLTWNLEELPEAVKEEYEGFSSEAAKKGSKRFQGDFVRKENKKLLTEIIRLMTGCGLNFVEKSMRFLCDRSDGLKVTFFGEPIYPLVAMQCGDDLSIFSDQDGDDPEQRYSQFMLQGNFPMGGVASLEHDGDGNVKKIRSRRGAFSKLLNPGAGPGNFSNPDEDEWDFEI